jgi:hypothetical protein
MMPKDTKFYLPPEHYREGSEQQKRALAWHAERDAAKAKPGKPRHKFGAVRTEHDGRTYASKAEARYAKALAARIAAGDVLFALPQVGFPLPGKTKYVVDFVEFHADGTVHFIDVKGMVTPMFTLKKKQVEALNPIEIEVVK